MNTPVSQSNIFSKILKNNECSSKQESRISNESFSNIINTVGEIKQSQELSNKNSDHKNYSLASASVSSSAKKETKNNLEESLGMGRESQDVLGSHVKSEREFMKESQEKSKGASREGSKINKNEEKRLPVTP